MKAKTAYTKIDLLMTMVCISVLMLCLGAVGLNGREMAKRTVCAANINQNLEAMLAYANESDGELPKRSRFNCYILWLTDLERVYVDRFIEQDGMEKEMFYCPSNDIEQRNMDFFFDYWPGSNGFSITSYSYLIEYTCSSQNEIQNKGNDLLVSNSQTENAADTVLVTDTSFSWPVSDSLEYPNGIFQIPIVILDRFEYYPPYQSSNHLKTDAQPWGGNLGYLDGHVNWKPFKQMAYSYRYDLTKYWW